MLTEIAKKYHEPDPRIKWAREYHDKLMLHVHGIGLDSALEKINHYENDKQKEARDLFAISNKYVTSKLLAPADNVFSAKGGYYKYIFTGGDKEREDKFRKILADIHGGYSLSRYMRNIAFDKFITDPNGIITIKKEGEEYKPDYKSIYQIRNYEQNGIYVNWVIFEPHETVEVEDGLNKKKYEKFIAVDEENYYYCITTEDKQVEIYDIKGHNYKRVPAVLCSDIEDPVSYWKVSIIDPQIELLSKYMNDNSVLNIVEYFHNYPQQWEIVDKCPVCMGTGHIGEPVVGRNGEVLDNTCPACNGKAKASRKDVTERIEVKYAEDGQTQLTAPSGYIYMPTEPWKLMVDSLNRTWNMILTSHWNSAIDYGKTDGAQYATATGRWIDVQQVNNKLDEYSDSIELLHNNIVELLGRSYFIETFEQSSVHYGRNYLIESSNQLIKQYNEIMQYSNNHWMLDIVSDKWIETEYKDNDLLLNYYKKIYSLDPMPHSSLDEIIKTNNQQLINRKIYMNDYKSARTIEQVVLMSNVELLDDYIKFINEKENKNE